MCLFAAGLVGCAAAWRIVGAGPHQNSAAADDAIEPSALWWMPLPPLPPLPAFIVGETSTSTSTSTGSSTFTTTSSTITTTTATTTIPAGRSLYCFAVARPAFGEMVLIQTQLDHHTGIFQCDNCSIFSNVDINIVSDDAIFHTEVINSTLVAPVGGIYNMSLNTDIFLMVWKRVFEDERYMWHDWTVKVDPDAVFIPDRLRIRVGEKEAQHGAMLPRGVFLNNCKIGNHGPIEVISTKGMEAFRQGADGCIDKNYAPIDEIGEDVFTRRCWKHVGVEPLDDFHLLSEINCFENPTPCYSGKVVFHPFKTAESYMRCLEEAKTGKASAVGLPPACHSLGCSHHYQPGTPCQCNGQCKGFGNCCDDYEAFCIPHTKSNKTDLI